MRTGIKLLVMIAALAAAPSAQAQHPGALVVLDANTDLIYRISLLTERTVLSFDAPTLQGRGVAFDGADLWVVDVAPRRILRVDPETGYMEEGFVWTRNSPTAITWDGSTLWVADTSTDTIYTMDRSTGAATPRFRVPWLRSDNASATGLAWDGSSLWGVDSSSDRVYKMNPATGDSTHSFPVPSEAGDVSPWGIVWDGTALWVGDAEADVLLRLDPDTGAVLRRIPAPEGTTRGLGYLPGATRVEPASWGRVKKLYRP